MALIGVHFHAFVVRKLRIGLTLGRTCGTMTELSRTEKVLESDDATLMARLVRGGKRVCMQLSKPVENSTEYKKAT